MVISPYRLRWIMEGSQIMGTSRHLKSGTKAETLEDQRIRICWLVPPWPITLGITPPTVDSGLSYQCSVLSHRFAVIIIIVIKMMMIPKIVIMMMMIPKELFTE